MKFSITNLICLVLFFVFTTNASFAQKDKMTTKAAEDVCDCLEKQNMKDKTAEEAKTIFGQCFMEKAFSHFSDIAKENGIDASNIDRETGEKIGMALGMKMATLGCKPYLDFALAQAEKNDDATPPPPPAKDLEEGYTTGKIVRVDKNNYAYIVIKDDNGKEQRFLWLYNFENSDKFTSDAAQMIGKEVEIGWQQEEIFLPSENAYFDMKIITELEEL